MWNETDFEKHLRGRLTAELAERGAALFAGYEVTRGKLVTDIYKDISGAEPNLSDHSADHIANVQDNALALLSSDAASHGFTAMDLYCLAMFILFHDVGNLFGRKDHHKKIGVVFDWARGTDASVRHEKTLVLRAAGAHTGQAADGTRDTLKEVAVSDNLYGRHVQLRSLAAVLRLADELAEGPQRTSEFRLQNKMHVPESRIFHSYASITHVFADRRNERVTVTYEVEIPATPADERTKELTTLLTFVFARLQKLDQERRYTRFYCPTLEPFKTTNVTMNFHCNGRLLPLEIPTLELNDKVVPGDPLRPLAEINNRYVVATLVEQLVAASMEGAA